MVSWLEVDGSEWQMTEAVVKAEGANGELKHFIGHHMQEYPDSGLFKTFNYSLL